MILTTERIIDELIKCRFTHVVWLPASETGALYEAMISKPDLTVVPVCREGEAVAIAAGLMLGGKKPVVFHQSTGFFESGDSIRGLALDLGLPLLMLIAYRGWKRGSRLTDSAAIYLEPALDAWGIKHYLVETDNDLLLISAGEKEARESHKPVAILIGGECV
jgi:sulfopyruvate decarboxylase subunit alpha